MLQRIAGRNTLRWVALPGVVVIAMFVAFNLFTPIRLMQAGIWPGDVSNPLWFGAVLVDALLRLAPLLAVGVTAAWLTAPAARALTARIAGGASAIVCLGLLASALLAGQWHTVFILGFGAVASVATAALLVRYGQRLLE